MPFAYLGGSSRNAVRRRTAGFSVLAVVASTLVVLAVKYDGSPIHDVDLNDGGVWVTNSAKGMLGRLNTQDRELDLGMLTSSTSDAVFQQAASVEVYDHGGGNGERSVRVIDTMNGTPGEPIKLREDAESSAANGTVAILDDRSGQAWLRRSDQLRDFDESTPSDFRVSSHGSVVVTRAGTALFLDRDKGEVQSWALDTAGAPVRGKTWKFDGGFVKDPQLSAVGERPVVVQEDKVYLPGEEAVDLGGKPTLQLPGPEAEAVYVATEDALFSVPLGGGDPEQVSTLDVHGNPAAPAVVAGCVHAAWADPGTDNYLQDCAEDDGGPKSRTGEISQVTDQSDLVFRSNRDVVVLNDVADGNAWMVQLDGMDLVQNWDSVGPDAKDPRVPRKVQRDQANPKNSPPEAKNDKFGARSGSTVVLPVTLNDIDADGDILTVSQPPAASGGTQLSVVGEGTQIQATIPDSAKGTVSFDYTISDGHPDNRTSTAQVTLDLFGNSVDREPVRLPGQAGASKLVVGSGANAGLNVLSGWIDPEGDPLVLSAATSDDGEVDFRPDGTINFHDDGRGGGTATIEYQVRGGKATAPGKLAVTVVGQDKAAPVAVADHFSGRLGDAILLRPLRNDRDPLGQGLMMPRIEVTSGGEAEVDPDPESGTAVFRPADHGTYYLEYEAVADNGAVSKTQRIRVDVIGSARENHPPIATRDIASVKPDGVALVDVLANDIDPDEDVLVVQGVEVPDQWTGKVKASLVDKRFARVEAIGPVGDSRPTLTYQLSDGDEQVTGTISVTPSAETKNRRPVAVPDEVTVRAGTMIDVPVLDNDEDPDADRLSVNQQDLDFTLDPALEGKELPIVADGDSLRVLVPRDGPTQLVIGYGARDPEGMRADTRLVLNILKDDKRNNRPPRPRPIRDRTITGQQIRVPVDSFGADPDGDPVVFKGIAQSPELGRIVRSGSGWFDYEPFADETGTDSFKVLVADQYGATGVAQVHLGIAPRLETNQAPVALNDELLIKPDTTVHYPVMDNDSDPDGDSLIFERELFTPGKGVDATYGDDAIAVKVPGLDGEPESRQVVQYSVTDGLGVSSTALLTVVARKDAPEHAPVARDDTVTPRQVHGKRPGDTVDVKVLANDSDLDGARSDLTVKAVAPDSEVIEGDRLQVTVRKGARVVPYKVIDATDQSSYGFVYVDGADTMLPTVDPSRRLSVEAGDELRVDLDDVVVVRAGRSPRIARTTSLEATQGHVEAVSGGAFSFRAPKSFHGAAAVTLEVIDGDGLNNSKALGARVTIPITVRPARNVKPDVRSAAVVLLAGGESKTLRLDRLATDVNADDTLRFTSSSGKDGVEAEVQDDRLVVRADESSPGGQQTLTVSISDGHGKPVETTVEVEVVPAKTDDPDSLQKLAAAQPPMTLQELAISNGKVGQAISVDVKSAVLLDPFPKADKKLKGEVRAVAGKADVSVSGTTLRITPRSTPQVTVGYLLSDGSGQPGRVVPGRIVVTVAGKPGRPSRPQATPVGASSVRLGWSSPADNGSPITGYVVSWRGADRSCPGTQCTISGLSPGTKYSFRVRAVNGVDPGPWSEPSNAVKPDKAPSPMSAPVIRDTWTDRDGRLHLSWKAGVTEGSKITRYQIVSSPRTADRSFGSTARSTVWSGLRNGTSYTFRIRAVNDAGPGPWSQSSKASAPFSRPSLMKPPAVTPQSNGGTDGKGYLQVAWPRLVAPGNGYDAVTGYQVRLIRDAGTVAVVPVSGAGRNRYFDVANGHSYRAQVRARNRAGWGPWSSASGARVVWDRAKAPTRVHVKTRCISINHCKLKPSNYDALAGFTTPADNGGYRIVAYSYRTSDGYSGRFAPKTQRKGVGTSGRVHFSHPWRWNDANGYQVRLTPITSVPGVGEVRGVSSSYGGTFKPWAKPFVPTVRERVPFNTYIAIKWNCDKGNGNYVKPHIVDNYGHRPTIVRTQPLGDGKGCYTFTSAWQNVPRGSVRCQRILVWNSGNNTIRSGVTQKTCARTK